MYNTRSSSSQEVSVIKEFLKSSEFYTILKEAVKEETTVLIGKINELQKEVHILMNTNIDLIKLLTDDKVPQFSKENERLMIKKTNETTGIRKKTTISLCRKDDKGESSIPQNEEVLVTDSCSDSNNIYNWRTVESRRRKSKKHNGIIGKDNNTGGGLKAVEKKTQIYISRLHPDTTLSDVTEFLKEKFPEVKCEKGQSKYPENYSSFKITIDENHFDLIMNPDLWPRGIYINKFFRSKNAKSTT